MPDVYMPRLSDSMEEGRILQWLKNSGDQVHRGEELVEIETDKATVAFEAEHDGVLEIVAARGATRAVGELIAHIGEPSSVNISPTARRLAEAHGLNPERVPGTGPQGRITRADVSAAISVADDSRTGQSEEGAARAAPFGKGDVTRQALNRTQQTIARRMAESRSTIPDFTLEMDVEIDSALEALAGLRASAHEDEPRPTLNDLIVKACGQALREFPIVNGAYRDGQFEQYSRVNIGVAVAAERAVLVPTVFDADRKTVIDIARDSRRLAGKVRDGSISPADLSSGTFTVSNLGMYGVRSFRAVINPPQAAILAVGTIRPVRTTRDDPPATRQVITLTLSCDHRILYGAEAAQFLARIAHLLQAPTEWCLGQPASG